MRLRDVPHSQISLIHPAYRPIVMSRRKRFVVRRSLATRIRNRILWYAPLPRVFPAYCETCTLSSRFFHVIQRHTCSKKNESRHIVNAENELRIAHLGMKSKAKDANAVMERVPNPQHIDLSVPIHDPLLLPGRPIDQVPKLSDLCASLVAPRRIDHFVPTNSEFEFPKPTIRRTEASCSQFGYICDECTELFPSYCDYDEHLRTTDCAKITKPAPIAVQIRDSVVPQYSVGRRTAPTVPTRTCRVCSACHRDDFRTNLEFHEHIFECSRMIYATD